jgi:hypothetical protein
LETLRALLIQRGARLQERPALTAPGWGTLLYPALRNRVEGIALGLMAAAPAPGTPVGAATGGPWDWACEVAAACCALRWDPAGAPVAPAILGGPAFNREEGRQAYHDRERDLDPGSPFTGALTHGELLLRLRRLNGHLGWDHESEIVVPLAALPTSGGRGALWSALYAGGHALLTDAPRGSWDPGPFADLLE